MSWSFHSHIWLHGRRLPFPGVACHRFSESQFGGHFPDGGDPAEACREEPLGPPDSVCFSVTCARRRIVRPWQCSELLVRGGSPSPSALH